MSASAASISPAHPSSTPRFVRWSATMVRIGGAGGGVEGGGERRAAPRDGGRRAAAGRRAGSSRRPCRHRRAGRRPASPASNERSNSPEYERLAASDIDARPSSSRSPSSTAGVDCGGEVAGRTRRRWRSSRQALPMTRSSSTRSAPAAAGSSAAASSSALAGSVNARGQQIVDVLPRGRSVIQNDQHAPMALPTETSVTPWPPAMRRAHPRCGEARAAPAGPARRARVAADRVRSSGHRVHPRAAVGERIALTVRPATRRRSCRPRARPGWRGSRSPAPHGLTRSTTAAVAWMVGLSRQAAGKCLTSPPSFPAAAT